MRIAIKPATAKRLAAKLQKIAKLAEECCAIAERTDIGTDWPAVDRIMTDARDQVACLTDNASADIS